MTKIGILRCKGNEDKCPLTNCFKSLREKVQAFSEYEETELTGVFTLSDSVEKNVELAKLMQAKGAENLHFVTCSFCHKGEGKTWHLGNGYCSDVDSIARRINKETGMPCMKGTAHLPEDYKPEVFK